MVVVVVVVIDVVEVKVVVGSEVLEEIVRSASSKGYLK